MWTDLSGFETRIGWSTAFWYDSVRSTSGTEVFLQQKTDTHSTINKKKRKPLYKAA